MSNVPSPQSERKLPYQLQVPLRVEPSSPYFLNVPLRVQGPLINPPPRQMTTEEANKLMGLWAAAFAVGIATSVGLYLASPPRVPLETTEQAVAFVKDTCNVPTNKKYSIGNNTATLLAAKNLQTNPTARADICSGVYDAMLGQGTSNNAPHSATLLATAQSLGVDPTSIAAASPAVPRVPSLDANTPSSAVESGPSL